MKLMSMRRSFWPRWSIGQEPCPYPGKKGQQENRFFGSNLTPLSQRERGVKGCTHAMLLVCCAARRDGSRPRQLPNRRSPHVNVFSSGQDGYAYFRIPALEAAPDGSLLAFAEARKYNAGDPGMENNEIDLVCKAQHGQRPHLVGHAGDRARGQAVVVGQSGHRGRSSNQTRVALVSPLQAGLWHDTARPGTDDCQVLARWSDDNGQTWSAPQDLTAASRDMKDPKWRVTVIGPGGMIQDRAGRLVAAAWKFAPFGVLAVYSEDHGRTWQRSQPVPCPFGDENQVVELSDGRILMDFRQEAGPHRWLAESRDGGRTWSPPRPGVRVGAVCCAIERYTLKSAGDDRDRILWTGPKGSQRHTLVARLSYDEGKTFPVERLIAAEPAAYSDLTLLKDKSVGVLWERADYRFIAFTRLTRDFLEPK